MSLAIGLTKTLPVSTIDNWDADSAMNRVFEWAGWPENPNPSKAKKAFIVYDKEKANLKESYVGLVADVVDGKLTLIDKALSSVTLEKLPELLTDKVERIKNYYSEKFDSFDETSGTDTVVIKSVLEVEEPKPENINMDFVITKASIGADGVRRWAATVSKFATDEQGDEVTKEFYSDAIKRIDSGLTPMPALVVSHYDDNRSEEAFKPVPDVFKAGITTSIYIDGDKPKAKGEFLDTPLGKAAFLAIKSDLEKQLPHEERTRISMAFRPLDSGIEKSEDGHTVYKSGMIRHFALTRVPIVKETEIMVQKSSAARKTKFEDASSIVGNELATELDKAYNGLAKNKSEADDLVEKSESEKEEVVEKAEAYKQHVKEGKFAMGDCITTKLDEGKQRKQAIAMCLGMQREAGGKSKADLVEKMDILEAFDDEACRNEYIKKGYSEAAADIAVINQVHELMKLMTKDENSMDEQQVEKNMLSAPLDKCIASYTVDGMDEKEARKLCQSDEAIKARILAAAQKGDLVGMMKAVITDETVEVVDKAEEGAETTAKPEETVNQTVAEVAASDKSEETQKAEVVSEGESEPAPAEATVAVNTTVDKAEVVAAENDGFTSLVTLFKSALSNQELGQQEKYAVVNGILEKMADYAREEIKAKTPASPADTAEMIKAALQDAIAPVMAEFEAIKADNIALKSMVAGNVRIAPASKQLVNVNTASVEKSNLEPKGALNSRQMADLTVNKHY